MAITNTIGEGGNTTKGVEGDRGGLKIYRIAQRYFRPVKIVQNSLKVCEVI
jgi:hypothetical protein